MDNTITLSGKYRGMKTGRMFRVCLVWIVLGLSVPVYGQAGLPGLPAKEGSGQNPRSPDHVTVELVSQYDAVTAGQRFGIAVVLDVATGWHLYANPKQGESGLETQVKPLENKYVRFGKVIYDPGKPYKDKITGYSNHIYQGRTILYVPAEVLPLSATDPLPATIPIRLGMDGLTCDEANGSCKLWQVHEASMEIPLVPEKTGVQPNRPEVFSGFDISKVDWQYEEILPADSSVPFRPAGEELTMPEYQPREWKQQSSSVWLIILAAMGAGMLLNIMPCVLPVIPLKVLSLIQQSQVDAQTGDRFKAVKLSLVFSAGILLVFIGLAVMMSVFKILYGQQFQSDAFKFVMLMIIFVLGLSMLGLFEIVLPGKVTNIQVVRKGYVGALGMGVLATLLATPCSAPLLGPVLTWSLSKPTTVTVMVFVVVGIGMAAPYVALTAFPKLLHRIPRAGTWMIRLKQGLGFVMLGVAAYLIFLFPAAWHLSLIVFCLLFALAIWLGWQVVHFSSPASHKIWARGIALLLVVLGGILLGKTRPEVKEETTQNWLVAELVPLHQEGKNVMVEFTADWCPNCKYVEKTVLKRKAFQEKLQQTDTQLMIADWTQNDPAITELLTALGSKSIPFLAIFPGNDSLRPIVLRDIYTLDTVLEVLDSLE